MVNTRQEISSAGIDCLHATKQLADKLAELRTTSFSKAEILLNEVYHGIDLQRFREIHSRVDKLAKRCALETTFDYHGETYLLSSEVARLGGQLKEADQFKGECIDG